MNVTNHAAAIGMLALIMLPQTSPHAQGRNTATDNELYAGYCLGVLDTQQSMLPTIYGGDLAMRSEAQSLLQRHQQRFAGYLMSRVLLIPDVSDAFIGVLTARRQGQAQTQSCFSQNQQCLATANAEQRQLDWSKDFAAATQQNERSIQKYHACLDAVGRSTDCQRTQRCLQSDSLPF